MAIINNSRKFIFVHVPKAAGTSVTNVLAKYTTYRDLEIGGTHFGEEIQSAYKRRFGLSKHAPASIIKQVIGDDDWNNNFKFSIVRNPYSRVISTYKFLLNWEGTPEIFKDKLSKFKDINEYIASDIWEETDGPDSIFRPQAFWLTDSSNRDQIIVDYIGRLESLDEDLAKVASKIEGHKIESIISPVLNTTKGNYDLNKKSIGKINKFYVRDFHLFGYDRNEI